MATERAADARTGTGFGSRAEPEPAHVRPARLTHLPVDLPTHYNNRASSDPADTSVGAFTVWSNSFPARHLPPPGQRWQVGDVPFVRGLPPAGGDNLRCAGQYVRLPVSGPVGLYPRSRTGWRRSGDRHRPPAHPSSPAPKASEPAVSM